MQLKVCVIYRSGFGHTAKVAAAVAEGVREVADVDCLEIPVEQRLGERVASCTRRWMAGAP